VIVEIAFGFGDPKSSRQHRGGEIFRARLAVASGDREDFQREGPAVIGCKRLVGLQRVGRPQKCEIVRNISIPVRVNDRACAARFCKLFDKIVSVEIFSAQCDEQFTRFNRTRVGANLVDYDSPVPE
jgi:hypothetical protein